MNQDNSSFGNAEPSSLFEDIQVLSKNGATSDTYKVRLYGKWHFLKRLKTEFKSNPLYILAFEKEFDLGFQLTHPNIVRYYSKGSDRDGFYIITEYVDGLDLQEYLLKNPSLPHDKQFINKLIREILSVLDYLHNNQIIHLDIKPENILITSIGKNIKLIDLGFSSSDSYDAIPCGTPNYSSPEQFEKPSTVDVTSDIFSFGKLLIFLFTGSTSVENIYKLPFPYRTIALKCTQIEPEARYATVNEIIKGFETFDNRKKTISVSTFVAVTAIIFLSIFYYLVNRSGSNFTNTTNVEKLDSAKPEQPTEQLNAKNGRVTETSKSGTVVNSKTLSLSAEEAINKYYTLMDSLFTDFDKELPNLDKTNYTSLMNEYNSKMKTVFEWYDSKKSLMDERQKSMFEIAFVKVWDRKAKKNFEMVNPLLLPILSNTLNKRAISEDSIEAGDLKKFYAGQATGQLNTYSNKRIYTHTDSLLIARINKSEYYPHMKKMLISIMNEFSTEENLRNTIKSKFEFAYAPLKEYITTNDKYLNKENDSEGNYFREFKRTTDEFFYYATYLSGCYATYLNSIDSDLKNKDDKIYSEEIKKYRERLNSYFASRYDFVPNF
jgi:serine/threonine protein kinase